MVTAIRNTLEYLGLVETTEEHIQEKETHQPQTRFLPRTPKNVEVNQYNEIFTIHPRQYSDVKIMAENFREGIPVILNVSQMEVSEAKRVIDFASGLTEGLYGTIERVTAKVFLLSPEYLVKNYEETDNTFFTHK